MTTPPKGLTPMTREGRIKFTSLREANVARQAAWCPDQIPDLSFRGVELAGETGEVCNVIKKLERERHGWRGSRDTVEHLAEELADVQICADLAAMAAGIDLEAAVVAKFNATSEKVGLPHRLVALNTTPPAATPGAVPAELVELSRKATQGRWISAIAWSSVSGMPIVAEHGRPVASLMHLHLGKGFESHDEESKANGQLIEKLVNGFRAGQLVLAHPTQSVPAEQAATAKPPVFSDLSERQKVIAEVLFDFGGAGGGADHDIADMFASMCCSQAISIDTALSDMPAATPRQDAAAGVREAAARLNKLIVSYADIIGVTGSAQFRAVAKALASTPSFPAQGEALPKNQENQGKDQDGSKTTLPEADGGGVDIEKLLHRYRDALLKMFRWGHKGTMRADIEAKYEADAKSLADAENAIRTARPVSRPGREAIARELAVMHVENTLAEETYDWNATDRIWKESFLRKADRLLATQSPVPAKPAGRDEGGVS